MNHYFRNVIGYCSILSLFLVFIAPFSFASVTDTQWYALFLSGKKAGFSKTQRVVNNQVVTTTVTTQMQLTRADSQVLVKSIEESVETLTGQVLAFSSIEEEGGFKKIVTGIIRDEQLYVEIKGIGEVQYQQMPWNASALLFEGQRLLAMRQGLVAGTQYNAVHFVIAGLQAVEVHVAVNKEQNEKLINRVARLIPVTSTVHMSGTKLNMRSFVDSQQRLKKVLVPMMGSYLEVIESSKAYALSANQRSDFFNQLFVSSPSKITKAQRATPLTYSILSSHSQVKFSQTPEQNVAQLDDGSFTVQVSMLKELQGSYPYRGTDPQLIERLTPNAWVQNRDPRIISLAKSTVKEADSAGRAAQLLENFVRDYIVDKTLSVGYASALQVLQTKRGDCTEHALLLVAMLKAVGIPARVASGVVYVEQFSNSEQVFIPHAWAQAYIDGQWVSYDAALSGFNSGHIQLAQGDGDPKNFFSLINTLGNFEITAVTSQ